MGIYCGIDWAEAHHDVTLIDEDGHVLAHHRISTDATGLGALLEFYPQAIEAFPNLQHRAALTFLQAVPSPTHARRLTRPGPSHCCAPAGVATVPVWRNRSARACGHQGSRSPNQWKRPWR